MGAPVVRHVCSTLENSFPEIGRGVNPWRFGKVSERPGHSPAAPKASSSKNGAGRPEPAQVRELHIMLVALALVLFSVAMADAVTAALSVPVPGAVLVLLAASALFASRGGPTPAMSGMFDALIPYAPMLFVPAGAGVVADLDLIATSWLPLTAAITLGTAGALVATGMAAQMLLQRLRPAEGLQ